MVKNNEFYVCKVEKVFTICGAIYGDTIFGWTIIFLQSILFN
ncbi:MAG: hypothetical protein K0S41_738 [Anaerocolumna sp.]|jgi:hypothetical protein|nr:hypothetical protein [Anaerocolumna sp.]